MNKTKNKVDLIGYTGNDPDVRHTSNDEVVVKFSMATNDTYSSGDRVVKNTQWHDCVMFGNVAMSAANILKKGMYMYVHGSISYYEREVNGVKSRTANIRVREYLILDNKKEEAKREPANYNDVVKETIGDETGGWEDDDVEGEEGLPF